MGTGCITHRGQHKSVAKPKDINLHAQEGCAGPTRARGDQPWMGTLSCWGNMSAGYRHVHPYSHVPTASPASGCDAFHLLFFCPPPPFFSTSFCKGDQQPRSQREMVPICPAPWKHGGKPSQPQHAQTAPRCLMPLESVGVLYVPNFPLHQPSYNQLGITTVF